MIDHTDPQNKLAKSFWLRCIYIFLAWLCILLGTIGIFIPGLPTVDFYILASFFAAKGSKRMHEWFIHHRWFGPMLKQWNEEKKIPKKAKYASLISMTIAALIMIVTVPHIWSVIATIICMILVQIWIWTRA